MPTSNKPHVRALHWSGETILSQSEVSPEELNLESILNLNFGRGPLVDGFWLQGVAAVWCTEGQLRVDLDDREGVTLRAGEFGVFYPGHMVHLSGLDKRNALTRMILTGRRIEESADSLGFYDCFVGSDPLMPMSIAFVKIEMEKRQNTPTENYNRQNAVLMRLLKNLFVGIHERIRRQGPFVFFDAVRLFNADLNTGAIRVKQVASILNVSTNTLHLAFAQHGFKSPGDFITRRQARLARRLLVDTRLPIKEIAWRCGFQTAAHFTTFIKKQTGLLPKAHRQALPPPPPIDDTLTASSGAFGA